MVATDYNQCNEAEVLVVTSSTLITSFLQMNLQRHSSAKLEFIQGCQAAVQKVKERAAIKSSSSFKIVFVEIDSDNITIDDAINFSQEFPRQHDSSLIAVTALPQQKVEEKLSEIGFDEVLYNPLTTEKIIRVFKEHNIQKRD